MLSASLIIEARRRAGLSQRELALRLGKRQAEIARWERGHVLPSFERLRQVIAACGLELTCGLATADDSYDEPIFAALTLPTSQRLTRGIASADRARRARALATGSAAPAPFDVTGVLRSLRAAAVACVLIGEIAEVIRGSPVLPTTGVITIVPRAGERSALDRALVEMGGRSVTAPSPVSIDAAERWQLDSHGAELVIAPAPAGSHGYDDLRRDATIIRLTEDVDVLVTSLIDLVRLAEASPDLHDRGRVPALRRTLERATSKAVEDVTAA